MKDTSNKMICTFRGIPIKAISDEYFKNKEIIIPISMFQWIEELQTQVETYKRNEFVNFMNSLQEKYVKE